MTDAERERTHCLWDRLAMAAPAHVDSSARHLLETVSGWIGADRAGWVGTARVLTGAAAKKDALLGWRFRTIVYHPPPTDLEAREARKVVRKGLEKARTGMSIVEVLQHAGTFRVHRLLDGFVDLAQFAQTYPYDVYYRSMGVQDRMWVCAPVSDESEVMFVFDRRTPGCAPFTASEAQLAGYAIRGLTWFVRQLLYSHGLPDAQEITTATERLVVQLLMTNKSEREIARELNQSPHTTHDHVKEIYRKFGVKSRTGLMAVWLSKK